MKLQPTINLVLRYRVSEEALDKGVVPFCKVPVKITKSKELKDRLLDTKLALVKSSENNFSFDGDEIIYDIVHFKYQLVDIATGLYVVASDTTLKDLYTQLDKIIVKYLQFDNTKVQEQTKELTIFTQEEYVKNWYNLYDLKD